MLGTEKRYRSLNTFDSFGLILAVFGSCHLCFLILAVFGSCHLCFPTFVSLVLDLDAAYSGTSLVSPDQADEFQELTYVDIDTFLASFESSPTHVAMGMVRTSYGIDPYVAFIDLHFVLR